MRHQIFYEIQTVAECPYRFLFDSDATEFLKESRQFKYSNIYFFTKGKKLRFDLDRTYLTNKRTLKTILKVGDNQNIEIEDSLFNVSPKIKQIYDTHENYNYLCADNDDFWSCEIDEKKSTNNKIKFLQKAKTGEIFDFYITPENVEKTNFIEHNNKYNNRPEVIYVGQSFRMLERISSHKTLLKAVSELNDFEELKIFFVTFKYGYGGHKDYANIIDGDVSNFWLSEHSTSKEFKSKINLVERFLIHFLKPKYNVQHVKTEIQNDRLVKKLLLKNDIDTIALNIGVYGKKFEFWSENQQIDSEFCSFNFLEPEKGYQKGLVMNWGKASR